MALKPFYICFYDLHHYNEALHSVWSNTLLSQSGGSTLTGCVCTALGVHASSGYRLAVKQRLALKAVAEGSQESEHIGEATDCGQSQGVLLLVEICWWTRGRSTDLHLGLLYSRLEKGVT